MKGGVQMSATNRTRTLWAVSDLHINAPGNRDIVADYVKPHSPQDWLIVAGDISERLETVIDVLRELRERFDQVIFTPGNHELYAQQQDQFKGRDRYDALISACRSIGVITPEDRFPEFAGHTIVPMFTLWDHSWRDRRLSPQQAIDSAVEKGIVLTDHWAISPYVDVPQWCRDRLKYTVGRLSEVSGPTILVNHWPLVREAMHGIKADEIALWSGTRHTEAWPTRYYATSVIYGHLHFPKRFLEENVTHIEVSLGYPREWQRSLQPRLERKLWPYAVLTEEVSIP